MRPKWGEGERIGGRESFGRRGDELVSEGWRCRRIGRGEADGVVWGGGEDVGGLVGGPEGVDGECADGVGRGDGVRGA